MLSPNGAGEQSPGQDHEVIAALGQCEASPVQRESPEGAGQLLCGRVVPPFQGLAFKMRHYSETQGCIRCANFALGFVASPLWG